MTAVYCVNVVVDDATSIKVLRGGPNAPDKGHVVLGWDDGGGMVSLTAPSRDMADLERFLRRLADAVGAAK